MDLNANFKMVIFPFLGARSLRIDEWMRLVRSLLVRFIRSLKMSFAAVRVGGGWVRCRVGR